MRTVTGIRAALPAAIALATLLLGTCSDTNIVALLTNEVKRANNKFLVVQEITPTEVIDVNPGVRWSVAFDRPVDPSTVDAASVRIEPSTGITLKLSFSPDSKILYIEAEPFLADTTVYMITISAAVKAADGSDMEKDSTWSFTTGIYPAGIVTINGGSALANSTNVTLTLYCNDVAEYYSVATTEAGLTSWTAITTWPTTTVPGFPIDSGDGSHEVFLKLKQGIGSSAKYSVVKSDAITLDQTPPSVEAGPQRSTNTTLSFAPTATASDLNGIKSYLWTCVSPEITLASPSTPSPTISIGAAAAEALYSIQLEVRDNADNPATDTLILQMDKTPPNAPPQITVAPVSPVFSPVPRWEWIHQTTEPTQIFKFELRNSLGQLFYGRSNTTAKAYSPKVEWPDYSKGTPPGTYTMTVWEMDSVGNVSAPAASTVDVTSILPVDRAELVDPRTKLEWWTVCDPRDPTVYPKNYVLYIEYWDSVSRTFLKLLEKSVEQVRNEDLSFTPELDAGIEYRWWIEIPDFGLRRPEDREKYWSFTTAGR